MMHLATTREFSGVPPKQDKLAIYKHGRGIELGSAERQLQFSGPAEHQTSKTRPRSLLVDKNYSENNQKQIRAMIGLKLSFYLTITLRARDLYRVIVDQGAARVNYHAQKSKEKNLIVFV